mmetsp:Transcript_5494/g.14754  ORF Transcript_5494/g.14754 Transcript_5494/m.14754 type:complete len:87 (+) Transcript_5494:93-353(+)
MHCGRMGIFFFCEKWGCMLIFWTLTKGPYICSAQSMFSMRQNKLKHASLADTAMLFAALFAPHYVWDSAQVQRIEKKRAFQTPAQR